MLKDYKEIKKQDQESSLLLGLGLRRDSLVGKLGGGVTDSVASVGNNATKGVKKMFGIAKKRSKSPIKWVDKSNRISYINVNHHWVSKNVRDESLRSNLCFFRKSKFCKGISFLMVIQLRIIGISNYNIIADI